MICVYFMASYLLAGMGWALFLAVRYRRTRWPVSADEVSVQTLLWPFMLWLYGHRWVKP